MTKLTPTTKKRSGGQGSVQNKPHKDLMYTHKKGSFK
jgi:hypothetical protein